MQTLGNADKRLMQRVLLLGASVEASSSSDLFDLGFDASERSGSQRRLGQTLKVFQNSGFGSVLLAINFSVALWWICQHTVSAMGRAIAAPASDTIVTVGKRILINNEAVSTIQVLQKNV